MHSRRNWVNFRVLGVFVVLFGACSYEAPSAGSASGSSSSSSSGMGAAGGSEQSSSASSGSAGFGGMLVGGGGIGGFGGSLLGGHGGIGGIPLSSSSSSGEGGKGTGGSGGNAPGDPGVECGGSNCDTMLPTTVCCVHSDGSTPSCVVLNLCFGNDYKLKCDDRVDCGANYCCFEGTESRCKMDCVGNILCKNDSDCPSPRKCTEKQGQLTYCGP